MRLTFLTALPLGFVAAFAHAEMALPDLVMQHAPQAVVDENLFNLNKFDWNYMMTQYPDDLQFMLPDVVRTDGRAAIGGVPGGYCTERASGGLLGAAFLPEETYAVGDAFNVSWRVEADWLAEPCKGAVASVLKDGSMQAQVTTFDTADMVFT